MGGEELNTTLLNGGLIDQLINFYYSLFEQQSIKK
jgi:hypothetical protein